MDPRPLPIEPEVIQAPTVTVDRDREHGTEVKGQDSQCVDRRKKREKEVHHGREQRVQ